MDIVLQHIPFYYQTVYSNKNRRRHMEKEFRNYCIRPVYSPNIVKQQQKQNFIAKLHAGAHAHMRIIDAALRKQAVELDRYNKLTYSTLSFLPFVLLEDDISMYRKFPKIISVPDSTDLLYIGISRCSFVDIFANCVYKNYGVRTEFPEIVKIDRMLSNHGILYCSLRACTMMSNAMSECMHQNIGWDIVSCIMQGNLKVYALKEPLVYQDKALGGSEEDTHFSLNYEVLCDLQDFPTIDTVSNYCSSVGGKLGATYSIR